MFKTYKILVRAAFAVATLLLVACGQGPTPYPSQTVVPGTVTTITLCGTSSIDASTDCSNPPATTGGAAASGFVNRVQIYQTANPADRAIVFLHDAWGDSSCGVALDLGLYALNAGPSCSLANKHVNGNWLSNNKVIAVFPQGQSLETGGQGTGSATWNNWAMDSGQDDVAFLQSLVAYLRANYEINSVYVVGYSNGGMLVNRMWCESPSTFDGYVSIAGPASTHYLEGDPNFGAQCAPSASGSGTDVKPYYAIVGGMDSILCDTSDVTGCSGSWDASTWNIVSSYTGDAGFRTYRNPDLIGELYQQQVRIGLVAGCSEVVGAGTPDSDSSPRNISWSNCGGLLKLQEVIGGSHWISYFPGTTTPDSSSLEQASGAGTPTANGLNTGLLDKFVIPFLNKIRAP